MESKITKLMASTNAITEALKQIFSKEIYCRFEEFHSHIVVKVNVKGSIIHAQLQQLMSLGEIELIRSGEGITITIKY